MNVDPLALGSAAARSSIGQRASLQQFYFRLSPGMKLGYG